MSNADAATTHPRGALGAGDRKRPTKEIRESDRLGTSTKSGAAPSAASLSFFSLRTCAAPDLQYLLRPVRVGDGARTMRIGEHQWRDVYRQRVRVCVLAGAREST